MWVDRDRQERIDFDPVTSHILGYVTQNDSVAITYGKPLGWCAVGWHAANARQ